MASSDKMKQWLTKTFPLMMLVVMITICYGETSENQNKSLSNKSNMYVSSILNLQTNLVYKSKF